MALKAEAEHTRGKAVHTQPVLAGQMTQANHSWYPAAKYRHEGRDVLKVTWKVSHDHGDETRSCSIHYADGDILQKEKRAYIQDEGSQEKLQEVSLVAQNLVAQLGFVKHCTFKNKDNTAWREEYEAVPQEDPDTWESWDDGYWESGEKRVSSTSKASASTASNQVPSTARIAVQSRQDVSGMGMEHAIAKQADGMPGVAFRPGRRQGEPTLDIPNGTKLRCLREEGQWVSIEYDNIAGFVKRRNIAFHRETLSSVLEVPQTLVTSQADGHHHGAAFRLATTVGEPCLDIPNGNQMSCWPLRADGTDEWFIVEFRGMLGVIKKRNARIQPPSSPTA